jgi:hypothetical protein
MRKRPGTDEPPKDDMSERLERAVAGGLRSAIHAHGPITPEWIGSAVKRVIGNLRTVDVLKDLAPPRRGPKRKARR